ADVLERGIARVARNRKHRLESGMQPDLAAILLRHLGLQELLVAVELDGEQVRHLENAGLLAEILADALLLGEGISHRVYLMERKSCRGRASAPLQPSRRERSTAHLRHGAERRKFERSVRR